MVFANAVVIWVFVSTLDGPYSLFQQNDLIAHLESVREAIDSGSYYSLEKGLYPQAWYVLVAMVVDLVGVKMAVAINAVNYVLIAFVFPLSMSLFLRVVFFRNRRLANVAVFVPLLFAAFPWSLLVFGPLYPNLSGCCMLPIAMVHFVAIFSKGISRFQRMVLALMFCLGALSLVLIHPSSVFVGIVLLTPYVVHLIWSHGRQAGETGAWGHPRKTVLLCIAFIAAVVAIWTLCYCLPVFASTVSFHWAAYDTVPNAMKSVLLLSYTGLSAPQIPLALLVILGAVYCVIRRCCFWALAGYTVVVVMLVLDISTEGALRHYLTGFWYTDSYRTASVAAMAAMPLAAIGIHSFCSGACWVARHLAKGGKVANGVATAAAVAALACAISPVYIDNHGSICKSGMEVKRDYLYGGNNLATNVNPYDKDEYEFVEKVKEVLPEGETVVNIPYDGSAFAVGLNGIDCLFTGWFGYDVQPADSDMALIRGSLSDVASNVAVQQVMERHNVKYVLVLDYGNETDEGMYAWPYDRSLWRGISSIDDSTPGFETVLSEGDMRLYRISSEYRE